MKKILLLAFTLGVTIWAWSKQQVRYRSIATQNDRFASAAADLKNRASKAQTGREAAEHRGAELRELIQNQAAAQSRSSLETATTAVQQVQADPAHQGGWVAEAGYLYLPKQNLTNADFQLLKEGRLTDEAALLLGMSPAEREATDELLTGTLAQFRQLEAQHMEPIQVPQQWQGADMGGASKFAGALTYHIPSLEKEVSTLQLNLDQQLQQTLGASRAQLIGPNLASYFHNNLDDLGSGDRTVGFIWEAERDGTYSLWYGQKDARHGDGQFVRVPDKVEPDSQISYYANLVGVKLPGQN